MLANATGEMKVPSKLMVLMVTMAIGTAGCSSRESVQENNPELRLSGTVEISQRTAALVVGGAAGSGVLYYQGQEIPFQIGGVGLGGIGYTELEAQGDVYNLDSLDDFTGTYGQVRFGFTAGSGEGQQWLQNASGVYLVLTTQTRGLALGTGLDGMVITFPAE